MNKIFVIAGDNTQARDWIRENLAKREQRGETTLSLSDYVTVDSPHKLRGIRDPHGVFIGTWRDRVDIREVVDELFIACNQVNRSLQQIRDEVHKLAPIKPTPKIKGLSPVSAFVDEAAGILAQEIDNEVLRQMNGGSFMDRQEHYAMSYDQLFPTVIKAIQELNDRTEVLENART